MEDITSVCTYDFKNFVGPWGYASNLEFQANRMFQLKQCKFHNNPHETFVTWGILLVFYETSINALIFLSHPSNLSGVLIFSDISFTWFCILIAISCLNFLQQLLFSLSIEAFNNQFTHQKLSKLLVIPDLRFSFNSKLLNLYALIETGYNVTFVLLNESSVFTIRFLLVTA